MLTTYCAGYCARYCGRAARRIAAALAFFSLAFAARGDGQESPQELLEALAEVLPQKAVGFTDDARDAVARLVPRIESAAERFGFYPPDAAAEEILGTVRGIVEIKQRADDLLARTVPLRTQFVAMPPGATRRQAVRNFLTGTATLTELSGRLRYLSSDVFRDANFDLSSSAVHYEKLVDIFLAGKSSIGAAIVSGALMDPPGDSDAVRLNDRAKTKILQLIRVTRHNGLLSRLAQYIRQPGLSPQMTLWTAVTVRDIGLPQDPQVGRDKTLPAPEITAGELHGMVGKIDPAKLAVVWRKLHAELLAFLDERRRLGVAGDEYRVGTSIVRGGDWLLMRNPSPYNLFTDLHPGLFTHVGVVVVHRGSDGKRRFLVVDLPEQGSRIPSVTVDTFVKRTLDYVFLRHSDPQVGPKMGQTVASVIGNASQFDLNFRSAGITRLKGEELRGKKIEGYCAGLLLLAAQETSVPLTQFFPIPEHPAGGMTLSNLAKLDVSMQSDFLSPTGPLFSPFMKIVGRREPMYSPTREIEQTIYDHFAIQLREAELTPSRDWFQSLRLSLAVAAKDNPTLAKALADAAGVNRNMNLVAAAKLGAVVETLDEIAYGASAEFLAARRAVRSGRPAALRRQGVKAEEIREISRYQQRHSELVTQWRAEQLAPRDLRVELVRYYIHDGKKNLDNRFFHTPP
ncbi:MAG: hypothetical protein VB875_18025 [Pirellulales bacterium]